ncbi:MAG TPA: PIN domain-containing protein [Methanoregulaceae archaeon]|nr:PIN domain-containing protein [Methanoregulaceae archaeon]HPD76716.1 PIN domain-containing protein [Methanoregulaceae archaeon]HRY76518.1 PIN domain-containing protein [Methanoregulaceae archaeon]
MYLVDTWAWIDYFDRPDSKAKAFIDGDEPVKTSVITLSEIMTVFVQRGDERTGHAVVDEIIRASEIIPVDTDVGVLSGMYDKRTIGGGIADRLILATAEYHRLTILTGDKHFRDMQNVEFIGK